MRNSTGKFFLTKWTTQNYHLAFEVIKEKNIYIKFKLKELQITVSTKVYNAAHNISLRRKF